MKKMRDLHNFSAKAFKSLMFTGAQGSKKLEKVFFTTSMIIFPFRENDILRNLIQRDGQNLSKDSQSRLVHRRPSKQKAEKSSFPEHLRTSLNLVF